VLVIELNNYKTLLPMDYFLPEEMLPSEQTLKLIRHIAYTYRVVRHNGVDHVYCIN
jgi:hypothetical protein